MSSDGLRHFAQRKTMNYALGFAASLSEEL